MVPGVPEPACTVTAACCVLPPAETEIVALPAFRGSTAPVGVTVTTDGFVEFQENVGETGWPEESVAEAVNPTIVPATSDVVGVLRVRFATGPVAGAAVLLTLTWRVRVLFG